MILTKVPQNPLWTLTWVCRCSRMAQKSGGNRSWRVAAHWPHLMKAAPLFLIPSSSNCHACTRILLDVRFIHLRKASHQFC